MDKNAWRKEFQERWALSNDTHDIRDSLVVRRLLENLEAAEQQVQEERHKSLGMANEINLAVKSYKEMEKRAAEAEGQLAECKDKLLAVVATDEWHMVGGNYGDEECPFCNANRAYGDEHNSDCSRQAAAKWLETDSPK